MTTPAPPAPDRVPLRFVARDRRASDAGLDGAWWPQSRDLQVEVADLLDHFPAEVGHVRRLLYSRPDWELDPSGAWARKVRARRGVVKVGSFPGDDTHLMVLLMATGARLRVLVVPSTADPATAARAMALGDGH